MPYTIVRSHSRIRNGKRYYVRSYRRRIKGSEAGYRSGERFRRLERKVYREYRRKGYKEERAKRIAKATAGKVFWQKYGKERGREILRREK